MRILALTFTLAAFIGCAFDRDYSGSYDATTGRYLAGVTLSRASDREHGQARLRLAVTGERKPIDFKQVIPEIPQ